MTGDQFKAWCRALGFTQPQAAQELGVSVRMVQKCCASIEIPRVIEQACIGVFARFAYKIDNIMLHYMDTCNASGKKTA